MYKLKQPWEKYNINETVYLYTWTAGYQSAYRKGIKNPFPVNTARYKIWAKGKRDAKKI